MGCGCGGAKNTPQRTWTWTGADGRSQTFNTQIEAEAMRVRNGGSVSSN